MDRHEIFLHQSRLAYRRDGAGSGPTVLLIHGLAQDSSTWSQLAPLLDGDLVAPDLPGHGDSEPPAGDHSLGAYASTLRDLLLALEQPHATIVGHSLGGGVALQFAYQFPQMVSRLVLIDSGGLGPDLSPMLRAATLPGADTVLELASKPNVSRALVVAAQLLGLVGEGPGTDVTMTLRSIRRLADPDARRSFLRTVQAVIELSGQAVSARGKLYLMSHIPTLILWGEQDHIIPLRHGRSAHEAIDGSRFEIIAGAGHFSHIDAPEAVGRAITAFLKETRPADLDRADWGRMIRSRDGGNTRALRASEAAERG